MTTPQNGSSPSKSRTSSSTVATTSIRPRTKRHITGLEDFAERVESSNTTNSSALGSPVTSYHDSPFDSRAASPIPSKHPSRSSSLRPPAHRDTQVGNGSASSPGSDLAVSLSGIWGKSWTSLQGLASNVLGSDLTDPIKDNPNAPRKLRTPAWLRTNPMLEQWGPLESSQPGAGSQEERRAVVRARQRQELLSQGPRGDSSFNNPALRYKRRTSDDFESSSAPPTNNDNRDALVYVHEVVPQDTLPGISIKFNCSMGTIKKANGMWSNDGIQIRKTLIIPIDACNVKGKRVDAPDKEASTAASGSSSAENSMTPTQASADWGPDNRRDSTVTIKPSSVSHGGNVAEHTSSVDENPWTHESWILIDGHSKAIEIVRLPRHNLGFFARARRKSNPLSPEPSPNPSLEQPRPSLTNSETSPTGNPTHHRSRGSTGSQEFARQMKGPGGVGTLKGKGPSAPGPAEDKLNKVFGQTLNPPSVSLPRRPSLDSQSSEQSLQQPITLENFGSAIQGWMNKMAKSASKAMEPPSSSQQSYPRQQPRSARKPRPVRDINQTSTGELIELENAFEIGEDDEEHEYGDYMERGRDRTPTNGKAMSFLKGSPTRLSPSRPRIERPESERRGY